MNSVLLCLSLVFQPSVTSVPQKAFDFAFIEAQEHTVIGWLPHGNDNLLRAIPSDIVRHMLGMGNDKWQERDKHKKALKDMGVDVFPWLVHGFYLGDAEIRFRCENLMRDLSACEDCHGTGGNDEPWGRNKCVVCRGEGRFWPLEIFDD